MLELKVSLVGYPYFLQGCYDGLQPVDDCTQVFTVCNGVVREVQRVPATNAEMRDAFGFVLKNDRVESNRLTIQRDIQIVFNELLDVQHDPHIVRKFNL